MPYEPVESKRVYQRAEAIADQFWELIMTWEWFAKRTVGLQLAKAADSIGANIAEAGGRFHPGDVRNFFYFARGSLRETKYWLRRGIQRGLIPPEQGASLDEALEQLAREISQCISFQKQRTTQSQPSNHLTT
ncbi:MAG TPA: four helix bundle protein [Gemmataceae bacterium]|nr:four helix bundle protein [Gemmataceae bacterium]